MDSDGKGKSWVGSIFSQFESICQDVDDFMRKDHVKYVENQVQSVGDSVKQFYSDVVQDILPPSGDEVKLKEEPASDVQVDTRDQTESVRSIRAPPVSVVENQSPVGHGPIDTLRNSDTSSSSELEHSMQYTEPTSGEPSGELTCGVGDHKHSTLRIDASPALSVNSEEILTISEEGDSCDGSSDDEESGWLFESELPMFEELNSNENGKHSTLPMDASPGLSVNNDEILIISKEGTSCNGSSDDLKSGWLFDSELSMFEELNSNRSLSPRPVAQAIIKVHEDYNLAINSKLLSGFDSGHSCDGMNDENDGIDEDITRALLPETTYEKNVLLKYNHRNPMLPMAASPGLSVHTEETFTISKERVSCNDSSDDTEPGWLLKRNLPMIEELNSNEIGSLSPRAVASAIIKVHEKYNLAVNSAFSSGLYSGYSDDGMNCDSNREESFDVSSTCSSCNNLQLEMGVSSYSCSTSTSPRFSVELESASPNLNQKAENLVSSHVEPNNSAPSSATNAHDDIKATNMLPALEISESNAFHQSASSLRSPTNSSTLMDANTSVTGGPVSIVGPSHSIDDTSHEDAPFESTSLSSETGNSLESDVDISDLNMETIDLTTNVKHDAVSNFTHPTFHGRRNFRYYKKLIKDAFASRKRLSKEYEHLAILYGDIDTESRQLFEPSSLLPSPITSLHAGRTLPLHETGESEWELL